MHATKSVKAVDPQLAKHVSPEDFLCRSAVDNSLKSQSLAAIIVTPWPTGISNSAFAGLSSHGAHAYIRQH